VLLLDSQVVMWLLNDNPKLGRRAREMVRLGGVHVSAATVWELTIKSMLGKLTIPEKLSARLVDLGYSMLHVTAEHADGLRDFPELSRHDPFDRLIVAQANQAGLRLLTADRVLLGLGRDFIVDATA
jgi:PIN domain nuclease of toxin-antitoxin system